MRPRNFVLAMAAVLLLPLGALAQAQDPYADLNRQVQQDLKDRGFYNGPVNGEFGSETQAALARFQLSIPLPASGQLDEATLGALGIASAPRALGGSCDGLLGPEKERCVQQGGTVEARSGPSASTGASAPAGQQ